MLVHQTTGRTRLEQTSYSQATSYSRVEHPVVDGTRVS